MNSEQRPHHFDSSVDGPIAARTRRRLQFEPNAARTPPPVQLGARRRRTVRAVTVGYSVVARTRTQNGSSSENGNNTTTNAESEPVAARTRARVSVLGPARNRRANAGRGRGRTRHREIPIPDEHSPSQMNNSIRPPTIIRRRTGGFSIEFTRALQHELLFDYFHDFQSVFPVLSDNLTSMLEATVHSSENTVNNSISLLPPELSTDEISDPLNAFKCAICLDLYVKKEPVVTKCGHIYCGQCIINWLYIAPSCPKCNATVDMSSLIRVFP